MTNGVRHHATQGRGCSGQLTLAKLHLPALKLSSMCLTCVRIGADPTHLYHQYFGPRNDSGALLLQMACCQSQMCTECMEMRLKPYIFQSGPGSEHQDLRVQHLASVSIGGLVFKEEELPHRPYCQRLQTGTFWIMTVLQ